MGLMSSVYMMVTRAQTLQESTDLSFLIFSRADEEEEEDSAYNSIPECGEIRHTVPHSPRLSAKLCAMESGEIVVRFFGMKDMDSMLTSSQVLPGMYCMYPADVICLNHIIRAPLPCWS